MASGGRKELHVKTASDREPPPSAEREKRRQKPCSRSSARESNEKREYVPPHRIRTANDVSVKRESSKRSATNTERRDAGVSALQLEYYHGRHNYSGGDQRRFRQGGLSRDDESSAPVSGQDVAPLREVNRQGGEGRRERGERRGREDVWEQLKKGEEKVTEALQLWREGRASYHDVEPRVASVWSRYQRVMERGRMEQAVRENIGQRVWRSIHYPIIELLRKQGLILGCPGMIQDTKDTGPD